MQDNLTKKLDQRSRQDNKRSLFVNDGLQDFVSNDYLSLARSEQLFQKISNYSFDGIINKNGSAASRLLSGNSRQVEDLETKLASIFKAESSLLFNSGYMANLAIVSSVPQKGDTILYDALSHVCLKEGAWLSQAESCAFRHNDVEDLEQRILRAKGDIYVIIESIYSMDGDEAPLEAIIQVCQKYGAKMIIDEAHGTGILGKNGSGMVCSMGLEDAFFARVYTFGKGMGVHGACVCGTEELKDFLINFGRSFIYTTALPMHSIFSIDAAFEYLAENPELQGNLQDRIKFFNDLYASLLEDIDGIEKPYSKTPIQPIIIPGNARIKTVSKMLQARGFDVRPILAPTVKAGSERLRISLHNHNSTKEIEQLLTTLDSILSQTI